MSLGTDRFFIKALQGNEQVLSLTDGRIFDPARDYEAESEDRLPYIIVGLELVSNNSETKDDYGEGEEDTDKVSVLIVADDREQLYELAELARSTIRKAVEDQERKENLKAGLPFFVTSSTFSAERVEYDPDKPCCYQTLTYVCTTVIIDDNGD